MAASRNFHNPEDELQGDPQVGCRSEQGDRDFIRQALQRGLSEEEIRSNLGRMPEFHRLKPEQDLLAYVRGLTEEESSGGVHNLGDRETLPAANANQARTPTAMGQTEDSWGAITGAVARQYIYENFEPSDWLAVVIRNRESGGTIQRITTAEKIASPPFQSWLRHKNAHGSDIYLSLNTFKEQARSRTKADVKEVRHLYLDLDRDGPRKLAAIRSDPSVPRPNYVLNTSPEKFQVVWKVVDLSQNEAESLLRSLAQRFGGDPAATDSTRVFRVPGFSNKKYQDNFTVTIQGGATPDVVYHRADFRLDSPIPEHSSMEPRFASSDRSPAETRISQSERDWSYALRRLQQGDTPENIVGAIAAYRSRDRQGGDGAQKYEAPRKANPRYYAEHTVKRAMEHLGLAKRTVQEPDSQIANTSRESSLSR
jgi:hypothetical protein